ncbi:MAG: hypothetical protein R2822_27965 [Spirosomataceae bacterium]
MKKITIVFALLLTVSSLAFSQQAPKRTAEERAAMMAKNLTKELSLTTEQSSKIEAIQLESMKKIDAIRAKGMEGGDRKAMRQEVKAINDASDEQVVAVLTTDQKPKYEAWKAKRVDEMKNRAAGRGRGSKR